MTAVEWLENKINDELEIYNNQWLLIENFIEQAKEMEKESQDEYAIEVLEFYHNSLFMIPLKDGEAKRILNYIKEQL